MQAFERTAPAVGDPMPSATLYDPAGQPVDLKERLQGKHTVLILGCLT